jgi:CBS domain containing-hemolysin-like protein
MFTLEDMLEELVGEIHDEFDKQQRVFNVKEGELLVEGTEELRVVAEHLHVDLSGKPTDTVNYWVINHAEHIPSAGEKFSIDGLEVVIESASRRSIRRVRLRSSAQFGNHSPEFDSSDGARKNC